jgi:hypothetical protein
MLWLAQMGGRQLEGKTAVFALSEANFAEAVHALLRDFNDSPGLQTNPLLQTKLGQAASGSSVVEQVETVRRIVIQMAQTLQHDPRQAKGYRALYHTYIQPAPTQEKAAELLDLPFSTYRRHLRNGIEQITQLLWLQYGKGQEFGD